MRKIHICHITTVHKDGDVRIFHKMCCSLAKDASFQVSCILPNVENRKRAKTEKDENFASQMHCCCGSGSAWIHIDLDHWE